MNKLRFAAIVLLAVVVMMPPGAGLVEAQAPDAMAAAFVPNAGTWSGTTSTGWVSFVVNSGGATYSSFSAQAVVPPLVCVQTFTALSGSISGGTIAASNGFLSLSGTFTSPTSVSGKYTLSDPATPGCSGTGTWTASAPVGVFSAAPASWKYGLVKVGTVAAKSFQITNPGGDNLVIGAVSLLGTNAGQFRITANGCSGHTLAPGGACSVTATFNPTQWGIKTAYLNFQDSAAGSPHKIPLTGKGALEQALNGGFNNYPTSTAKIPNKWTAASFASTDGKNTTNKMEGTASVRIGGQAGRTKTLTQTRLLGGVAGNTLLLSVWAKGQSIPTTAGVVQVQVLLYNGGTLVQSPTLSFAAGTYAFRQKSVAFTAKGTYNKIVIKLTYSKGSGVVWFDGLSLLKSP